MTTSILAASALAMAKRKYSNSHTNNPDLRDVLTRRIAPKTLRLDQLRGTDIRFLREHINFLDGEQIIMIYSYNNAFDPLINVNNDTLVGITNLRIFKLENGVFWATNLCNIKQIIHVENGWFRWDKIECICNDDSIETYGIYEKITCAYFVKYLKNAVTSLN